MKPGDTIRHEPSGEEWVVAAISVCGTMLSPAGWPESIANVADCKLVESCSQDESDEMMARCRKLGSDDVRRRWTPAAQE